MSAGMLTSDDQHGRFDAAISGGTITNDRILGLLPMVTERSVDDLRTELWRTFDGERDFALWQRPWHSRVCLHWGRQMVELLYVWGFRKRSSDIR